MRGILILTMKNGIVTCGILYDIPASSKTSLYLEPGNESLSGGSRSLGKNKAGVKAGPGEPSSFDGVGGRGGRNWNRWPIDEALQASTNSVIPWLKKRDVALLGWETPGYMPQPPGDLPRIALYDFALAILGIHLLSTARISTR